MQDENKDTRQVLVYVSVFMFFVTCIAGLVTYEAVVRSNNDTKVKIEEIRQRNLDAEREAVLNRALVESKNHNINGMLALDIVQAADSIGIPIDIAFALVREESSFRANVVSSAGAIGLTQVMPNTGRSIDPEADLFNPQQNLEVGFAYLKYLFDRYEDYTTALVAYNVGPTRVDRYGVSPYVQSLNYANRIMGDN